MPLSKWSPESAVGGTWLARRYGIEPVQPLLLRSHIAGSRSISFQGNRWEAAFPERYRPEPNLRAHLEFMLKHERIHLEFLARLFAATGGEELSAWAKSEPTGRYARRAGFLYEWLTGEQLDFEGVSNGGYIDALDAEIYFAASQGVNVPRWRVRDNLPGDRSFCPVVLLTDAVRGGLRFDVSQAWAGLEVEFGADQLARSAVWLTVKESRSSFAIEGEGRQLDRIRRFASVLETETGRHEDVFAEETLVRLQRAILGDAATRHGIRRSPIIVWELRGSLEVVHYIAPDWELAHKMLRGLAACEESTRGRNPMLRAAVLSFGFVYAHPLSDGNGRVSRFLINDVLRKDQAVPEPFILPVSAVIARKMRDYDRMLEVFSKPLMARYAGSYRFGENRRYPDGFTSTFQFDAYDDAAPAWSYPDLTEHVAYLGQVIRTTVEVEMREEAIQIRAHRRARIAIKEFVEGPDEDLDRIVRSVRENDGSISNKLRGEFPILENPAFAQRVATAVDTAFAEVPGP